MKLGYLSKGLNGKTLNMVRVLDGETVARNNRSMDGKSTPLSEQEEDEQYIRFEEDKAGGRTDEDFPF